MFRSETDSRGVAFQKKEEKYFKNTKKGENREFVRKKENFQKLRKFERLNHTKFSKKKNFNFEKKRKIQRREKYKRENFEKFRKTAKN